MGEMNKVMDPQKTAQTMREFEQQNMKMEMSEEMSKSTTDSAQHCFSNQFYRSAYILFKRALI